MTIAWHVAFFRSIRDSRPSTYAAVLPEPRKQTTRGGSTKGGYGVGTDRSRIVGMRTRRTSLGLRDEVIALHDVGNGHRLDARGTLEARGDHALLQLLRQACQRGEREVPRCEEFDKAILTIYDRGDNVPRSANEALDE